MSGSVLWRAAKARLAGTPQVVLAVLLSVVLAVSLTPSFSWATDAQESADAGEVSAIEESNSTEEEAVSKEEAASEQPPAAEEFSSEDASEPSEPAPVETPAASMQVDGSDQDAAASDLRDAKPDAQLANAEDQAARIQATISVIGVDEDGNALVWAAAKTYSLEAGTAADTLSEKILTDSGLTADYGMSSWGWSLNTITSPVDGKAYGWDENTGKYWQLFVNGEVAGSGASGVMLQDSDVITWYYSAWGDSLPQDDAPNAGEGTGAEEQPGEGAGGEGEEGQDPSDEPESDLPDYDAVWPSYANGGTSLTAPTGQVETSWTSALKDADDWGTSVSDPIVVNSNIYIAVGNEIFCKDAATGQTLFQATLAAAISSTARIAYADGLIIVPLAQGKLQALRADSLKSVWVTDALSAGSAGDQQPLTTLTVSEGRVHYGTASADWTATYDGFFQCVDVKTGRVVWSYEDQGAGFYWAGAAMSGEFTVIADDAGVVRSFAQDGSVAAELNLGVRVRATVVADGSTLFVVSNDGVLHKISVAPDGSMTEVASVNFGSSSTTTPMLANGKVIVAGASTESYANSWGGQSYYGVLAVIDAQTMQIEHSVTALSDGSKLPADSKSAPLVSVQGNQTYVYITCNSTPGGVYRYCVGNATAEEIYVPEANLQNYCMASIVADANGTLYYTNDSGTLFALKGVANEAPDQGEEDGEGSDGEGQGGETPSNPTTPSNPSNPSAPTTPSNQGADANSSAQQPSSAPATPAGTVAPSATPLAAQSAQQDQPAQDEEKGSEKDTEKGSKEESQDNSQPETYQADAETTGADDQGQGLNPLAVAGIVAGLAGLAGILGFVLRRRA